MIDTDAARPVVGELVEISPEGIARGWCYSQLDPSSRRVIAVVAEGRILATAVCDEPSDALQQAGFGDGAHGFSVQIAAGALGRPDRDFEITIEDLETGEIIGEPARLSFASPQAAPPPLPTPGPAPLSMPRAALDEAADDGWITGWCWDQNDPGRRIRLAVLIDGVTVGTTTADMFRPDLAAAGIGDGAHAFSYLLPWEAIAAKASVQIALRDADLDQMLPAATVFHRPEIVSIDDRLRDIERQLRLAAARADDARRRAVQDAERLSGIFRTIGVFFQRLAEADHGAVPTALVPSLADLFEGVSARRPSLVLDVPRDPLMTLCVAADGTADGVHDCLAALHEASVDRLAEIVLIDRGQSESAALIAATVQNLRVWRVPPGQSMQQARNQLVLWAGRDFAGFLSSASRVSGAWIRAVLATFEREPACGAICAKLVREDGLIEGAALLPGPRGALADFAEAEPGDLPRCDHRRAVIAATDRALIVRGRAFAAVDGLDPSIVDGAAAALDLCLRLWKAGAPVLYQPVGHVGWFADRTTPEPAPPAWSRERWAAASRGVAPSLGHALIIHGGNGAEALRQITPLAAGLIEAGLALACAAPDLAFEPGEATDLLRAIGVEMWRANYTQSIAAALRHAAPPVRAILVDRAAAAIFSPHMLRGVASDAALILLAADSVALADATDLAEWSAAAEQIWLLTASADGAVPRHLADKTHAVMPARAATLQALLAASQPRGP